MNRFHYFPLLSLIALSFWLSACSAMYEKHVQWETEKPEQFPVLHAIGYAPISLQKADNKTQKMLMAIEASKLAAYAELTEQVYGQQVDTKTTMSDLLIQNKQLTARVKGVIRGAKVVKSYPVGDDTYATELSLDLNDVYQIVQATNPKRVIKKVDYY